MTELAEDSLAETGGVTNDPGLICIIGDHPQCGQACLPITEYTPLIEQLEVLRTQVRSLLDRMAEIIRVAGDL